MGDRGVTNGESNQPMQVPERWSRYYWYYCLEGSGERSDEQRVRANARPANEP